MPPVEAMPRAAQLIALAMIAVSIVLTGLSFDPDFPAWVTGAVLGLGGAAWFCLPGVIRSGTLPLFFVIGTGLAVRLIYFTSEPVREIDYYRYLWDAAAVNAGLNPFAVPPVDAILGYADAEWLALAAESGGIVRRINYGHLATIYPPVGQAAFWLAHQLDPWGLTGLRVVFLAAELAGVWLLILLLKEAGRAPAWVALYWWNPLIAKELINSAHMDALLVPALVAAVLLAMRSRPLWSALALGVAAGVKIWPLVLAPVLICQGRPRVWIGAGLLLGMIAVLSAVPMVLGRLDHQSGLVAYAGGWERNDALFGLVRYGIEQVTDAMGLYRADPGRLARLLIVSGLGITAVILGWCFRDKMRIPVAVLTIAAMLFLLSPTGYPWYYVWVLPMLCLVPVRGLLLLGVMLPFYYLRFDMDRWGYADVYDAWIVWLEFGPVFALLAYDQLKGRRV